MDAPLVTVEAHLANGLPSFTIVGLPEIEVKEAKDRVRAALQNARFEFPARRITINLAPADLPKESGRFDLPIALGILAASDQLPAEKLDQYEFAGELALTGELRPIRGTLAMMCGASRARRAFVVRHANGPEAALWKVLRCIRRGRCWKYALTLPGANCSPVAPISLRRTMIRIPISPM